MTRALLLVVLAAPAVARGQTMSAGTVLFFDGASDVVRGRFISLAECQDSGATVNLSWAPLLVDGGAFQPGSFHTVYASNQQATGASCLTQSNVTIGTIAGPVGASIADQGEVVTLAPFHTAGFLAAAGYGCDVAADTPIYVCVQAYAPDGVVPVGFAKGTLVLSIAAPAPPTGVSAEPAASGELRVSWSAPPGAPAAYDYRVVAVASDPVDPMVHEATAVQALSTTMGGLVNGVPYAVQVYARSQAGNESAPSTATGMPVASPTPRLTRPAGDGSGCGAGAAGPVALLGIAALLARARRRPRGR